MFFSSKLGMPPPELASFVMLLLLVIIIWWLKKQKKPFTNGTSPPEPTGSLPILGHIPLLIGSEPTHKVLARLADKYGPIFKMRIGVRHVVVVSSSEMVKDCLVTNDRDLASRPRILAMELLSYNHTIFAFSPFGPCWRELRKVSTLELLSKQRVAELKQLMVYEVREAIKNVYDERVYVGGQEVIAVDMREWFGNLAMSIILRKVVGKSLKDEDGKRLMKAVRDFHSAGVFTVSDALPYLRLLDIGGHEKLMKETAKELDYFAQSWLESHRRKAGRVMGRVVLEDFMDTLMDTNDTSKAKTFDKDVNTIIKSTCLTMILPATDPTSVTLTWALCLLLNNPHSLNKVQQELDTHIGRERNLDIESDLNKLVYLQAVIKETLRLHPPSPVPVPHESMADVVVGGYNIPAGTLLCINIHKIHRDPLVWENPHVFCPERFLTTQNQNHIDLYHNNFELIPFSMGRRGCPGKFYALQLITFVLSSLIHAFDIASNAPQGVPVDMTEEKGLTSFKATPLEIRLTPRLPPHLYDA